MTYPPANATREETSRWIEERTLEAIYKLKGELSERLRAQVSKAVRENWTKRRAADEARMIALGYQRCIACGNWTRETALQLPVRIACSAKLKGRVFSSGDVLCHRHQTRTVIHCPACLQWSDDEGPYNRPCKCQRSRTA